MIGIIFMNHRHCGIICHGGEHDNDDEVDDVVRPRATGLSSYHLICDGGFTPKFVRGGSELFCNRTVRQSRWKLGRLGSELAMWIGLVFRGLCRCAGVCWRCG